MPSHRSSYPVWLLGVAAMVLAPGMARACSMAAECNPAYVARQSDGRLEFSGLISEGSVEAVRRQLTDNDTVSINSNGGDALAAIRLAALLRARNAKVNVGSQCIGPCALYVFLTARTKASPRGTWVLFDGNDAGYWLSALRLNRRAFTAGDTRDVEAAVREEQTLFREAGITPALVACLRAATGADPGALRRFRSPAQLRRGPFPIGRAEAAIVSKEALARWGVTGVEAANYPATPERRQGMSRLFAAKIAWIDAEVTDCAQAPVTLPPAKVEPRPH